MVSPNHLGVEDIDLAEAFLNALPPQLARAFLDLLGRADAAASKTSKDNRRQLKARLLKRWHTFSPNGGTRPERKITSRSKSR